MVAAARARATAAPNPLIDDPFALPLVRAVGVDLFVRWATGELDFADVDSVGSAFGIQMTTTVLAVRTPYFDQFLLDAAAAGIRQVVNLAAGLDARGYRLTLPAGTTVFEIDMPLVLQFKTATLADLGAKPTVELRDVPIDLRDDWPTALRQEGFDAGQPTAWIAEGLFPFLPPEAQDRLLDNITDLSAGDSRLAAEVMAGLADHGSRQVQDDMLGVAESWGEHGFDVDLGLVNHVGERNDVAEYLASRNWLQRKTTLQELLTANGLPWGEAHGTVFANNYYCASILQPQQSSPY